MASSEILVFIFTVLCISAVKSDGFVKLECKTKNVGHYGQQSLLECVVKTSKEAQDATIRMVAWKKLTSAEDEGDLVLGFNEGKLIQPKSGYRFAEPSWKENNMNVSLLITNTAVADDGYYKCTVIADRGDDFTVTTLKVQARYSVPTVHSIPEKIIPETDSTLICESHGGYPEGTLRWFVEGNSDWTNSAKMEVKQSGDGLFQLTSRLSLLRGSTFPKYICVVLNASGGKEDNATFETNIHDTFRGGEKPVAPSTIAAPLVVIGSLIVGLLFLLLLRRSRSQQLRRNSAALLISRDHQQVRAEEDEADVEKGHKSPVQPINPDEP